MGRSAHKWTKGLITHSQTQEKKNCTHMNYSRLASPIFFYIRQSHECYFTSFIQGLTTDLRLYDRANILDRIQRFIELYYQYLHRTILLKPNTYSIDQIIFIGCFTCGVHIVGLLNKKLKHSWMIAVKEISLNSVGELYFYLTYPSVG